MQSAFNCSIMAAPCTDTAQIYPCFPVTFTQLSHPSPMKNQQLIHNDFLAWKAAGYHTITINASYYTLAAQILHS